MNKLKVMTILGTRPEIIRLSQTIKALDKYFKHVLVHTGQNYDYSLNEVFFKDLSLRKPDYYLDCVGKDLGETMGNVIAKSYEIIQKENPDAILILGDTNSALSAISAKRLKCPIFHMEAGNRCWDYNVVEMVNRKIVDHIADINLPYTEHARRYLISEGIDGKNIFVTGSPMMEVINANEKNIENSDILNKLNLKKDSYILVSAHREENIDIEDNFIELMNSINAVAETYKLPIIFSTHPRTKAKVEKREFKFNPLVKSLEPFAFSDYIKLQTNAKCVLSDSGTLSEESAILGFSSVLLRTSTERPEALDAGTIIIGGIKKEDVVRALDLALSIKGNKTTLPHDYQEDLVSIKIVKIIQSYTEIVNKTTWLK